MKLTRRSRLVIIFFTVAAGVVCSYLEKRQEQNLFEYTQRQWCDAGLPIDELVECVDKKQDESVYIQGWRERDAQKKMVKKTKLPTAYREVSDFRPLKKEDRFKIFNNGGQGTLARNDQFENLDIYLPLVLAPGVAIQSIEQPYKENKCKIVLNNRLMPEILRHWDYFSRPYLSKDLLITKQKGRYKIYAALYEGVRLKAKKALYVVYVVSFCQKADKFEYCGTHYLYFSDDYNTQKDYLQNYDISENHKDILVGCAPYPRKIIYLPDPDQSEKVIYLSADKRVNPTNLYVKLNNRIFEISLAGSGKGE